VRQLLSLVHWYNARKLGACGEDSQILARIFRHVPGGTIEIGDYCHLRGRLMTWLPDSSLTIDDNCILQARSMIEAVGSVTIGRDAIIGYDVLISDGRGHSINWADRVVDQEMHRAGHSLNMDTVTSKDIVIGDGCWIGARSIILGGVTIGDGATVGAGSVVTKPVPEFTVVAGNPAQVVRELEHRRPVRA
jgi:acetyltransferase-like isoleucine patch superfamily enzyme